MKKLLFIPLILLAISGYCQKLIVTPDGLRDSANIDKTYIVLNFDGKTANELYNNAINYIKLNYKSPDNVIKSKIEGEYLKYITYAPEFATVKNVVRIAIHSEFTTELNFKDGKVKYEISGIKMHTNDNVLLEFSGTQFTGFVIFNKKGDLKQSQTKTEIENYFASQIKSLTEFLSGKSMTKKDDW